MSKQILIPSGAVWDYIHDHASDLRSERHIIAENPDTKTIILVSMDFNLPKIAVVIDDEVVMDGYTDSEDDCAYVVSEAYRDYILDPGEEEDNYDPNSPIDNQLSEEDEIYERESILDTAVFDFIATVLEEDSSSLEESVDDLIEDLKDHFLEYMATEHGLKIRRPIYIEDESGKEIFTEYPYEAMESEK